MSMVKRYIPFHNDKVFLNLCVCLFVKFKKCTLYCMLYTSIGFFQKADMSIYL